MIYPRLQETALEQSEEVPYFQGRGRSNISYTWRPFNARSDAVFWEH